MLGVIIISRNVRIEEIAAAEFAGKARFSVALTQAKGRFADLPYVPRGGDTIEVPCLTVDSYVSSTGIVPDPRPVIYGCRTRGGKCTPWRAPIVVDKKTAA